MDSIINPDNPVQRERRERGFKAGTYHVVPRKLYEAANGLTDCAHNIDSLGYSLAETYLGSFQLGIIGERSGARDVYNNSVEQVLRQLKQLAQVVEEGSTIMRSVADHYVNVDDREYTELGHVNPERLAPPGAQPPPEPDDIHF